jgi:hypothetical protein
MSEITGYTLTVYRGARAGLVRTYQPSQRNAARRFADRLDNEYGAICASVRPVFCQSPRGWDVAETSVEVA